jgi:Protein of unknown function (DUF3105)
MASRKEEKEARRRERLAWEREQAEQTRKRRLYSIIAGAVLIGAAAVAIVIAVAAGGGGGGGGGGGDAKELEVAAVDPPTQKINELDQAAKAAGCKLSNPPIEGRTHLSPNAPTPKYGTNPPTSGNHDPVPASDGAYSQSPGVKHLVHALEHGRIIFQYAPSIPERRLAQLKGLFDDDPYHLILVPDSKMPYQFAVTAWGHLAGCKRINDESFDVARAFAERYVDKGPEFVP